MFDIALVSYYTGISFNKLKQGGICRGTLLKYNFMVLVLLLACISTVQREDSFSYSFLSSSRFTIQIIIN